MPSPLNTQHPILQFKVGSMTILGLPQPTKNNLKMSRYEWIVVHSTCPEPAGGKIKFKGGSVGSNGSGNLKNASFMELHMVMSQVSRILDAYFSEE